jgi:hypothetical protein
MNVEALVMCAAYTPPPFLVTACLFVCLFVCLLH